MDMNSWVGSFGMPRVEAAPDSSCTAALHSRYIRYGSKNKVPGLSKLFLVSLHEKHNFQGLSSHLNSKTDILVLQILWKRSSPCSASWLYFIWGSRAPSICTSRELLFPNRPWAELWPANQAEYPWLCFRMQILLFLLEILKLNDLVRRSFLPTLVMGLLRDYLDYQVAFSVYQWPQDQFALLENKYNSCLQ